MRVTVSGGAGNICYSLLFRIASGEVFGKDTLVDLTILEVPHSMKRLAGVEMELKDCAKPFLSSLTLTDSIDKGLEGVDYAILVGAKPRSKGMERADLLKDNGKIFSLQGKALNRSKGAKVLVVGNPCNTNALILKHAAKELDPFNIRAMTRLDQNRATGMLAEKAKVSIDLVKNVGIFGNHSATMVTDYLHAEIDGKKAPDVINIHWLQNDMFGAIQNRGAAIIEARGVSSAASAANAIIDSVHDWVGFNKGEVTSAAIFSDNNPYGIRDDLYFSFPILDGEVVSGLEMDPFLHDRIRKTEKELLQEREEIREFL